MADINTVSLSGVVAGDVEIRKAKDMEVARFFIEVEGADERRSYGKFMVVAFATWAAVARKLSEGTRIVIVGVLLSYPAAAQASPGLMAFSISSNRETSPFGLSSTATTSTRHEGGRSSRPSM